MARIAALIAARVSRRMAHERRFANHASEAAELTEDSEAYEAWAVGLLDQIGDQATAKRLLTLTTRKQLGERRRDQCTLWPNSPMDEACSQSDSYGCKTFVAHPHCQFVLESTFCGAFRGSGARIDKEARFFSSLLPQLFLSLLLSPFLVVAAGMLVGYIAAKAGCCLVRNWRRDTDGARDHARLTALRRAFEGVIVCAALRGVWLASPLASPLSSQVSTRCSPSLAS